MTSLTISIAVSLIWLLAMLACAAHCRDGGRTVRAALAGAAAFAASLTLADWLSPQPNWIAVLIAIGAGWRVIVGPSARIAPILAGASAGLAAALAIAAGISAWAAVALTGVALAAAFAAQGKGGAPDTRHERVLVLVALAMPPAGLAADFLYGWQSAAMLGRDAIEVAAPSPPVWALAVVGLALLAGIANGARIRK